MKIKVREAIGSQLDLLVAKCIANVHFNETLNGTVMVGWWISGLFEDKNYWVRDDEFRPSTSWSQGGPLIEREGINISADYQDYPLSADIVAIGWKANLWNNSAPGTAGFLQWAYGPTPLIAAMRCFVASKLGSEVEVPDELA